MCVPESALRYYEQQLEDSCRKKKTVPTIKFTTGAGEFALWYSASQGYIYYRKNGKFYRDYRWVSEFKHVDKWETKEITKKEYLKGLATYGKTLQDERM